MESLPRELLPGIECTRACFDAACKRVLSVKSVLARIMGTLLEEYRGCPVDDIAERCIEGSPRVGIAPMAGVCEGPVSARVEGVGREVVDLAAGEVIFDVAFRALVPPLEHFHADGQECDASELIIDLEAQDDFYPGYPLTKRALYYCARLLNDQRGSDFSGSHYECVKKVCSIWICTSPPKGREGSVLWYDLEERAFPPDALGFDRMHFDLVSVVVVCLREIETGEREGVPGLVNLLSVLLSRRLGRVERLKVLQEYNIGIDDDLESEVSCMLGTVEKILLEGWNKGLSEGREEGVALGRKEGHEEGRTDGLAAGLRSLMSSTGWPIDKAMASLGIPESERSTYVALIR